MVKVCELYQDGDHLVILLPDGSEKRYILSCPNDKLDVLAIEYALSHDSVILYEYRPPRKPLPEKEWELW